MASYRNNETALEMDKKASMWMFKNREAFFSFKWFIPTILKFKRVYSSTYSRFYNSDIRNTDACNGSSSCG